MPHAYLAELSNEKKNLGFSKAHHTGREIVLLFQKKIYTQIEMI